MSFPEKIRLATARPPAVVMDPPLVALLASLLLVMAKPPAESTKAPVELLVLLTVLEKVTMFATFKELPMKTAFATPKPPDVTILPVLVLEESVVREIEMTPAVNKLPLIPIPPEMTSDPVVFDEETVVFVMDTTLFKVLVPETLMSPPR